MKFLALASLLFSLNASASIMYTTCSNAGGTIRVANFNTVEVVTHKDWSNVEKMEVETFKKDVDVNIDAENRVDLDSYSSCSSSTAIYAVKVKISKLNAEEKMPNAYSRNAQNDGTLVDSLICTQDISWMGGCSH